MGSPSTPFFLYNSRCNPPAWRPHQLSSSDSAFGAFLFHIREGIGCIGVCNRLSKSTLVYHAAPVTVSINLHMPGLTTLPAHMLPHVTTRSQGHIQLSSNRSHTGELMTYPRHMAVFLLQYCGSGHHPPYGVQISAGKARVNLMFPRYLKHVKFLLRASSN